MTLLWCCSGYIVVDLPFLAFYLCSAYILYLEYYNLGPMSNWSCELHTEDIGTQ
jgi:hypothetical protein